MQALHAGVRQFLHRLVVCLDDEILPFVPVAMERLLKNPDALELHDFIPLINQVISKFKVRNLPHPPPIFFLPVIFSLPFLLASVCQSFLVLLHINWHPSAVPWSWVFSSCARAISWTYVLVN